MRTVFLSTVLAAAAMAATPAAAATTIEFAQGTGQRGAVLSANGPLGQSFVALDTGLRSFGFQLSTASPAAADRTLTFTLREGAGLSGAALLTRDVTVTTTAAGRTPFWFDVDLGDVALTSGASYTALLSSGSARFALVYGPNINLTTGQPVAGSGDVYAGGRFLSRTGIGGAICEGETSICDANFRATFVSAAAIPEPATWAMMIAGFGLVGAARRRAAIAATA